jgi:DNA-directed RNA polymerase specialized sigma24 family protein
MAPPPEVPPVPPASPGIPLQPSDPVHDRATEIPEIWLNETEYLAEAEQVDRLAQDADLVTTLALARFEGPRYDYFANELAKYGMAVIRGWTRRGLILERCRTRAGFGLPEPPLGAFDDPDVVEELVNETVAKALQCFRTDVLMTGRWDPNRGASLRTFFIGQCLIRFPNIYRAWLGSEIRRPQDLTDHATLDLFNRQRVPSVDEIVTDAALAEQILGQVKDRRVRAALMWRAEGHSHAQIAERLNVTVKAVERMLANERNRMMNRGTA